MHKVDKLMVIWPLMAVQRSTAIVVVNSYIMIMNTVVVCV